MRSRVAYFATLIAMALLAVLFYNNCTRLVDGENQSLRDRIDSECAFVSEITKDSAPEDRVELLSRLSAGPDVVMAVFSADGSALYSSDAHDHAVVAEAKAAADQGKVISGDHPDVDGGPVVYAIYEYSDGDFLMLMSNAVTFRSVCRHNPVLMLYGVVFVIGASCFLYTLLFVRKRQRFVESVMRALDRFADGNFKADIEGFSKNDPEVAEYNAIISRIQDRVFKQRDRNQVLNTVMSQMQNGIIAVDGDLHVIFVTSVAKKLLGIVGNAEGLHVNNASSDVKLDQVFIEAMHHDGVYTNEVAARTGMGRGHRPLRLYVSAMKRDGNVVGALAIVEDITELRRLEQMRTDFAANVSHELRTPLTSIQGFIETLENGAIDNPQMARKFLGIIHLETDRLYRLINDILTVSKLESGDTEAATQLVRLDDVAYRVCEFLEPQAKFKHVTINNHLNDEPVYVNGNPDRVRQLLMNLTENAIKYNREGGSVTVQVFGTNDLANVTISDTGIGIPEENLPRLYERFYRVDKGRSREMGGTGLGLAIVKHIVRLMNGEIEVHSKYGEGTEFVVTLPLAAPPREEIEDLEE